MASVAPSSIRGRVKSVNVKGFAFAETVCGDVFISPPVYEALGRPGRGTVVELNITKGPKGLKAQSPPALSSVEWGDWQVGSNQVSLPSTKLGSAHPLSFACYQCGSEVLDASDISRVGKGSVWTRNLPHSLKGGKMFFNKFKSVSAYNAHCVTCSYNLGSIYHERFSDAEDEQQFPCAKLTLIRERVADDMLINCLVLQACSRAEAELAKSRLVKDSSVFDGGGKQVPRTTARTFELLNAMKKLEIAVKMTHTSTTTAGTSKKWTRPATSFRDGVLKYEIRQSDLVSGIDSREQDEFNFACGQMVRLHSQQALKVHQVDVYENPLTEATYASKKDTMPSSRELWVFHGTASTDTIMTEGFKVGGRDPGVRVANGTAHGYGVYTATGPGTPMHYAGQGDGNSVILAKGLEGTRGQREMGDCWAPNGDWLIFKTGEQLLPKYVVHW